MSAYVFDSETTGDDPPEVIQTAWYKLEEPMLCKILDERIEHFKPSKPITLGALAVHHILDEELADCPPSASFRLPEDCEFLIGHNVDYDWKAIGSPTGLRRICTLALARAFWPHLDSHTQGALIYHIRRSSAKSLLKDAHNALEDVRNCRIILRHILSATKDTVKTWERLWQVSELSRIPKILTFGKHKGMAFSQAPRSYLQWIIKHPDMDEYVKTAAKGAL